MDINFNNTKDLLLNASARVCGMVERLAGFNKGIKWKTVSFIIPIEPEPSHRPRLCGNRIYVPGAAKHQRYFDKNIRPKLNGLFINTPCKLNADVYCKTPSSFTQTQKILAEMKILRPWGNIGDVDNFLKTLMDQIQPNEHRGHVGIMSNDCLVISSNVNKYYSMTPRSEITITYMAKIPDELKNVLRID